MEFMLRVSTVRSVPSSVQPLVEIRSDCNHIPGVVGVFASRGANGKLSSMSLTRSGAHQAAGPRGKVADWPLTATRLTPLYGETLFDASGSGDSLPLTLPWRRATSPATALPRNERG